MAKSKSLATPQAVKATYPSSHTVRFTSIRSASRSLTGNGSDALSTSIRRRLKEGGGYVGNDVYVEAVN